MASRPQELAERTKSDLRHAPFGSGMVFSGLLVIGYFALALGLRWQPFAAGAAFADDWAHAPVHHLESARPLLALDLAVHQRLLFGPNYLIGRAPRILSALWWSLAAYCLHRLLRRWNVARAPAAVLPLVMLAHPALNELILWGVLSSANLGLLIAIASTVAWLECPSDRRCLAALAGLLVAGLGLQPVLMLPAALLVLDIGLSRRPDRASEPVFRRLAERLAPGILPPMAGMLSLVVCRYFLGLRDFADRGLANPFVDPASWVQGKFVVLTNLYANLYQAPLSWMAGVEPALGAFKPALILPPVLMAGLARRSGRTWIRASAIGLALPAVIGLVALPLLASNATPTGWRLLGAPLFVACATLGLAVAGSGDRWRGSPLRNLPILAIPIALIAVEVGPTLEDARLRAETSIEDTRRLIELRSALERTRISTAAPLEICKSAFEAHDATRPPRRPVVVSYRPIGQADYSVFVRPALFAYLKVNGVPTEQTDISEGRQLACMNCSSDETIWHDDSLGLRVVSDDRRGSLCRERTPMAKASNDAPRFGAGAPGAKDRLRSRDR